MRGARPDRVLESLFARAQPLPRNGSAVVALSGGSDSVALAALAHDHAREMQCRVTLVHVHHGRRSSADQDEAVATAVAAHLGMPITTLRVQAAADDEATLREVRYGALLDTARALEATHVLTGHHAQDQTETVLLALFRGTGPTGLRGIAPRRELGGISLLRPLLRADRSALQRLCERAHLPYVVDPTNADERYRRNALRTLLDGMRGDMPGLDRAVARCAEILREEGEGMPLALERAAVRRMLEHADHSHDVSYERLDAAARSNPC